MNKHINNIFALCIIISCICVATAFANNNWIRGKRAHPERSVSITVALKNRNVAKLQTIFNEVSNPLHENYRKFLTVEELRELVAPNKESLSRVSTLLKSAGASFVSLYDSLDAFHARFNVKDLEALLNVNLHHYFHSRTNSEIIRANRMYTLPKEMAPFVDVLGMVYDFPAERMQVHNKQSKGIGQPIPHAKAEAEFALATCDSKASYGYPQASDSMLYSQVNVFCCNGKGTKDASNPCSDNPPALASFTGYVYNNNTGLLHSSYNSAPTGCVYSPEVDTVQCNVVFNSQAQDLQKFDLYNIAVQLMYENGDANNPAKFPVALVTSPFVTPQFIAEYYDIPLGTAATNSKNSQSVAEFSQQYFNSDDLKYYLGNMSLPSPQITTIGPNNEKNPGDEATLDIEWILATGVNVPTTFWSIGFGGYLLEWSLAVLSSSNPPLVHSVSYSGNERGGERIWQSRVSLELQKMGSIGLSVMFSSGDAGATDVGHGSPSCNPFQPQFPSTSPYVTSVSATFFTPKAIPMCYNSYFGEPVNCANNAMGEVAVAANNGMDWTTGGGFSDHQERPDWQQSAVENYLKLNDTIPNFLPARGSFNKSNRAYPDVSAVGHNLLIIMRDAVDIADGTSASSPIFAGIVSMLNDYFLNKDGKPLGFLNPLLYHVAENYPGAFYDVTVGDNDCGDVLHPPYIACCSQGYKTAQGWDPVTGLGTPRFRALLNAIEQVLHANELNNKPQL